MEHMNSDLALNHRGTKVVIKQAKRLQESNVIDYLSRSFALRIARGAKIFVNGKQVFKPIDFDSRQFHLFTLANGVKVFGNLKSVENPKADNIDILVKGVFVQSVDLPYKME
jgi:hypothetical protein